MLSFALLLLPLLGQLAAALAPEQMSRRATVCNGHPELCDRSYGSVVFVGTHDSYAIADNDVAANQDQTVTQQLNDGIRLLQSQAHNENGVIKLCHTSCFLFDGGTLQAYLGTVKTWLDANPNEVLSLLIVNIDNLPPSEFDAVFKAVGLDAVSFVPSSSPLPASSWPTLGSMIDSNKRLVTFLSNQADPSVPYLIDEFTNVWETAFNVIDVNAFDCSVNRTKGDTSTQMFLINHFLDKLFLGNPVPDKDNLDRTNSASGFGSVGAHVDSCRSAHGRTPNFILVDYYEHGNGGVFQAAASINGVSYNPAVPIAKPPSTGSGTSSNGTSTSSGPTVSVTSRPLNNTGAASSVAPASGFAFVSVVLLLASF